MSKHESVSCDSCMKSNFTGDRFKCLRCFDYDLCRECYENCRYGNGANNEHSSDHPVQCIMTRDDFEFAYWGESVSSDELRIMAFTCPYCAQMGMSQTELYEHVSSEHADSGYEVICPVCVATPQADPNRTTDELAGHLVSDHITRQDRTSDESRVPRRLYHGSGREATRRGRARIAGGTSNSQSRTSNSAAAVDPIAELLTQLGGIRRANSSYSSTLAQIQQLQQQLGRRARRAEGRGATTQAGDTPPVPRAAALLGASSELYSGDSLRTAMSDASVMQLWTELVGANASAASSTALLESSLGYLTRDKDKREVSKTTSNRLLPPAANKTDNSPQTDARLLAPKLFERTLTDDEKQQEQTLLLDRSEFVSELLLALAVDDVCEQTPQS